MLPRLFDKLKIRYPYLSRSGKSNPAALSPLQSLPSFIPVYQSPEPAEVSVTTLSNGVSVLVDSSLTLPLCGLVVTCKSGVRDQLPEETGTLFGLKALEIRHGSNELESRLNTGWDLLGSRPSFIYDQEFSDYSLFSFKHCFPAAVRSLHDCLLTPKQLNDEVVARARMSEYWKYRHDTETLTDRVKDIWLQTSYAGKTLGTAIHGIEQESALITNEKMNKFRDFMTHPENVVLGFSGSADSAHFLALAEEFFGGLKPIETKRRERKPSIYVGNHHFEDLESSKIHGIVSFQSVPWTDTLVSTFQIMAEALGREFDDCGRVTEGVRGQLIRKFGQIRKMRAANAHFSDSGVFGVEFEMENSGTGKELMLFIRELIERVSTLSNSELSSVKSSLKRRIGMIYTDPESRLREYVRSQVIYGSFKRFSDYAKSIETVTTADVRKGVDLLYRSTPTVVAIGPQARHLGKSM